MYIEGPTKRKDVLKDFTMGRLDISKSYTRLASQDDNIHSVQSSRHLNWQGMISNICVISTGRVSLLMKFIE